MREIPSPGFKFNGIQNIQEQGQFKKSSSVRPHMEIIERLVATPLAPVAAGAATPAAAPTAARSRKSTGAASSCDSIEDGGGAKKRGARKKESECEVGGGGGGGAPPAESVGSAASVSSETVTPTQGTAVATPQVPAASSLCC